MDIEYNVSQEAIGYLVYAQKNGVKLSLGEYCNAVSQQVLDIMKVLTIKGGFKPEVSDALAFFLFEDNANAFIESVKTL